MLEVQEENTRTLAFIFIFKLRLIKFYEYFMCEFTLMHWVVSLEPPRYPEGGVVFHISAGSCHPFVFPLESFVYELFYVLPTDYYVWLSSRI